MATLQSYIDLMPPILKDKYPESAWISWCNLILERLSNEKLLASQKTECGVLVENDCWVMPPSDYRRGIDLSDPSSRQRKVPYEEITINGVLKLHLTDRVFDNAETYDSVSSVSLRTATSVTGNIADAAEDDYANYLLVVTAGTLVGKTFIIKSNDVSGSGVTKFYFEHALAIAWTSLEVTAFELVPESDYLLLQYWTTFSKIATSASEIPVQDIEEGQLFSSGLRYYAELRSGIDMTVVKVYESAYEKALALLKIQARGSSGELVVKPIRLIGVEGVSPIKTDELNVSQD